MKIAFFWTWDFSKNILGSLLKYNDIEVLLVVSQPDKPVWRKKDLEYTPIKTLALEKNIEVLQPNKLIKNTDFKNNLRTLNLDFIVVVAYWKIIPESILDIAKYGSINIHWSILPLYRWASPIQESIKNWDKETWLTIMYMSKGMDEWDILKIEKIPIDIMDKTPDIFRKFEKIWPEILFETLKSIIDWTSCRIPQDNLKATYCWKIEKNDGKVDFCNDTLYHIYNKFRSYYPWPWIFVFYNWKKLNIEDCICLDLIKDISYSWDLEVWKVIKINKKNIWVVCKDKKILILKQVKLEWKKSMDIISFVNWNKEFLDHCFQ